jgi:hypothetical protein
VLRDIRPEDFDGTTPIPLPGREYMAVRLTRRAG